MINYTNIRIMEYLIEHKVELFERPKRLAEMAMELRMSERSLLYHLKDLKQRGLVASYNEGHKKIYLPLIDHIEVSPQGSNVD